MRTTVELPDDLLARARSSAAQSGVTLKEFFIAAVEVRLGSQAVKMRRPPPEIGSTSSPAVDVLTPEQIDEAMFG